MMDMASLEALMKLLVFKPGNIDLRSRPNVNIPGTDEYASVRSKSFNFDGEEVLLPTVSDDGRLLTDAEAIEQYKRTGKHLGKFPSVEMANRYGELLHQDQAQREFGRGYVTPGWGVR